MHSLRHIQRLTDCDTANILACAIVNTCLDYCNALLYGIFAKNAAATTHLELARVIYDISCGRSATDSPQTVCWLPVTKKITYKIATITLNSLYLPHRTHTWLSTNMITPLSWQTSIATTRTSIVTASRAFAVAALGIENSLPASISASRLLLYILNWS